MRFNRQNNNIFTSWWWTVDKISLLAIIIIMAFGAVMVTTASPAVAERIGYDGAYFIKRQLGFLAVTFFIMIFFSFLPPIAIRRIATLGFAIGVILLLMVLISGAETKGARRWIPIGSFALQPSEFMKPFFIIVTAWMLSESKLRRDFNEIGRAHV